MTILYNSLSRVGLTKKLVQTEVRQRSYVGTRFMVCTEVRQLPNASWSCSTCEPTLGCVRKLHISFSTQITHYYWVNLRCILKLNSLFFTGLSNFGTRPKVMHGKWIILVRKCLTLGHIQNLLLESGDLSEKRNV